MQTPDHFGNADRIVSSPGRIRIKYPALYRSQSVKDEIESKLSTRKDIIAVHANPLTSRVLILYDGSLTTEEIFRMLGLPLPASGNSAKVHNAPVAKAAPPNHEIYQPWHLRDADAALAFHGSSRESGLSSKEVAQRLKHGLNVLPQPAAPSAWQVLVNQFKSLPVLLLGVSAALSVATGGVSEAVAIVAVLIMNGGIGFVTERRAESTIASLSELTDENVPVLRDGKVEDVEVSHIVPGDILVLSPGVRVAADARLIQTNGLTIDESALTGESMPVLKDSMPQKRPLALADRVNMAYRGTAVTMGTGLALVVGTGNNTEIGTIQNLMTLTEHPKTPIQKQLDQLGNQLVGISGGICLGVFVIGLLRGYGWLQMLKVSISLAIAAVPEGLPAVATTSLARGIHTMRDKNVLIRRLQAVETIGAIQIICLDKTGTLTMNRMSAVEVQSGGRHFEIVNGKLSLHGKALSAYADPGLSKLLEVCVLCNEAEAGHNGDDMSSPVNGSSTERALLDLAEEAGLQMSELRERYPLLATEWRAEGRNYMRTIHAIPGSKRRLVAVKGSPAEVLELCRYRQAGNRLIALTDRTRAAIVRHNERMAEQRLRVLGFAYAEADQVNDAQLVWVGLVGLADPLRPGVKEVIASFHRAGIRTVMLTGDQATTALSIGKALGLGNGRGEPQILDAEKMEQMDTETMARLAVDTDIFARVSPAHKLRIVQALQKSGKTVAMTGDGINDGPALRAADIGIAMGHGGTDLARSAADVVLKDDRLETMLEAVSQGRTIYSNIGKSLHFLVSSNLSEILVVLGGISFGSGSPLTSMQLLWINLLSDVLPGIALAAEPPEADVMSRPPRDPARPIIATEDLKRYAREGGALASGTMAAYFFTALRHGSGPRSSSVAFNALIHGQLMHALTCRSDEHSMFSGPRNRQLERSIIGSMVLQVVANIVPGLRRFLGIAPPTLADTVIALVGATLPVLLNDALKAARPKEQPPNVR